VPLFVTIVELYLISGYSPWLVKLTKSAILMVLFPFK